MQLLHNSHSITVENGNEGAIAIASALKLSRGLTSVDLGTNGIDEDGCQALSESLQCANALVKCV
jgi:hypothetical protein